MTRLSNNFDGIADGTTITNANSGGGSGDAIDNFSGTGTAVSDDDAPAPLVGTRSCLITTSSDTRLMNWEASWQSETEVWMREYFYMPSLPPGNTQIMELHNANSQVFDCGITTTGALRLRDNSATQRYISSALAIDTLHRIEIHVVHSATVGHMEARIYSGANAHGSTADQSIGSPSTNWDTGAASDEFLFGHLNNNGGAWNFWIDEVAIDDTGWIGSAVASQLDVPGSFTAVDVGGSVAATIDWAAVTGATDGYEVEVQVLDIGGNPAISGGNFVTPADWSELPLSPFHITGGATIFNMTAAHGLEGGRTYAARVRALTTDDN